jgi:hypothetical protein
LSAIARSCYLRRVFWQQKYRQAKQVQEELQEVIAECEARCRQLEQENGDLRQQVSELQVELAEPRQIQLPLGDAPPGQQYGANIMALSVNLARKLGVRRSVHAQNIFF